MRGREAAPAARLPRPVKLFGAVSLLNDFASEMIYPLLPAFVTGVLGAGPQALGALDGAAELAASVVKFGAAFWLQRGMDQAGAVLGPLVAWSLLATRSADVRAVIALSLAPGVAVLVLAVWAVKGGAARGGNGRQEAAQAAVPMPPVAARYRPLPPALFVISLFYLLRMPETLMILRSQQLGVSTAAVLLLWAALHVVRSSASFAGGRLTDRIGASRTMWL